MKNKKFDAIIIPEALSQHVQKGIRQGEKIYIRNKRKKMLVKAAAAAAVLLVCIGVFASQPALASKIPIIRNIFKLLQEDYSYQGDLDSVAYQLEETGRAKNMPEGNDNNADEKDSSFPADDTIYTKTVNGVTVSVSEAYCSVEAIYLSLMITSEEAFPATFTDTDGKTFLYLKGTIDYSFTSSEKGYANGGTGQIEGTFIDGHTYAGIYRIDILDIIGHDDSLKEIYRSLDSFHMDYTINQIIGDKAEPEPLDMQGKTKEDLEAMSDEEWKTFMNEITPTDRNQFPNQYENWWFDGPFSFHLPIQVDKEGTQIVTVDEMNDTGAGLYQVVRTRFEITVEKKCSEERMQSGVFLVILDADGNLLPRGNSVYRTYAINGQDVSRIYVYICDQTEYMEDIIKYQNDTDFKQILEKRALYGKEIVF